MIAIRRSGKNTGPGRLRTTASPIANVRISTSATRNTLMFSTNACAIVLKYRRNSAGSKNACLTFSQPGAFTTTRISTVKNTTVLSEAIATFRPAPPSMSPPRPPSRSSSSTALLQHGRAGLLGQPRLAELLEGAGPVQRVDRLVDARGEAAALAQHEPPLVAARDRKSTRLN